MVDEEGGKLAAGVTATEPEAVAAFVRRRAPEAVRIGIETGPLAVCLWNGFGALDLSMVCMDARDANTGPKVMLAKADRNDAARFARPRDVGAYFGLAPRRHASGQIARSTGAPTRS